MRISLLLLTYGEFSVQVFNLKECDHVNTVLSITLSGTSTETQQKVPWTTCQERAVPEAESVYSKGSNSDACNETLSTPRLNQSNGYLVIDLF